MDADFGRLLNDKIHSLAPGYALHQANSEWRFGIPGNRLTDAEVQFLFRDGANGCGVFAAAAVKYSQCMTRPESQDATNVTRLFAAERQLCICAQRNRAKQA